ncbi:MAG TPA: hypothetical protein VMW69_16965 [Spirochaetia bacterium]|nr:hypothetical protein [Spirochaetia bacterium]
MKRPNKIVLVGGGSVSWSPTLINDFLLTPALQDARYVIFDIDEAAGLMVTRFGQEVARRMELECTFEFTADRTEALTDADFVVITITTGGLEAMSNDIEIPEEYRIYQTVGDTVGPGGWARGLRNVPVFADLAQEIERLASDAIVLNYTNPMATCTKAISRVSKLRTVGLCHARFELVAFLTRLFGLASEQELTMRAGGINHFFWVYDLTVRGEDGFALLRSKLKEARLSDLIVRDLQDEPAHLHNKGRVASELFEYYGLLPYIGDRHVSEFFSSYLTGSLDRVQQYGLVRTTIDDRRSSAARARRQLESFLAGRMKSTDPESGSAIESMLGVRGDEAAADVIGAIVTGEGMIDVMNLPNEGQIANLPMGSVVETMGVADQGGFHPICLGELPDPILDLTTRHVKNQDAIVDAALTGDRDQALWALYHDPQCAHLSLPEVKEMAARLLEANRSHLPAFFG